MMDVLKGIGGIVILFVSSLLIEVLEGALASIPTVGKWVQLVLNFPAGTLWVGNLIAAVVPTGLAFWALEKFKGGKLSGWVLLAFSLLLFARGLFNGITQGLSIANTSVMIIGIIVALYLGISHVRYSKH